MGALAKIEATTATHSSVKESAVVEKYMMFNCHIRSWKISEISRAQKNLAGKTDVWSSTNIAPLREMERKKNLDCTERTEDKTSPHENRKRAALKRLGHVLKKPVNRITQQVAFGCIKKFEKYPAD